MLVVFREISCKTWAWFAKELIHGLRNTAKDKPLPIGDIKFHNGYRLKAKYGFKEYLGSDDVTILDQSPGIDWDVEEIEVTISVTMYLLSEVTNT